MPLFLSRTVCAYFVLVKICLRAPTLELNTVAGNYVLCNIIFVNKLLIVSPLALVQGNYIMERRNSISNEMVLWVCLS